jgi:hypothetical protein
MLRQLTFIMREKSELRSGVGRMRMSLFLVWLLFGTLTVPQDGPKTLIRFFNDSAKAANFSVDGHFGCSIPANPEGNNAYCDAEAAIGNHAVSVTGAKLRNQSCDLYVTTPIGPGYAGAEAHLSKSDRLNCFSYASDSGAARAKRKKLNSKSTASLRAKCFTEGARTCRIRDGC